MHILPLSATEIEARLSRLPEHVADQEYSPASEHPQSGKAVAQALNSLEFQEVDNTFSADSYNAQSGKAVAEAVNRAMAASTKIQLVIWEENEDI